MLALGWRLIDGNELGAEPQADDGDVDFLGAHETTSKAEAGLATASILPATESISMRFLRIPLVFSHPPPLGRGRFLGGEDVKRPLSPAGATIAHAAKPPRGRGSPKAG